MTMTEAAVQQHDTDQQPEVQTIDTHSSSWSDRLRTRTAVEVAGAAVLIGVGAVAFGVHSSNETDARNREAKQVQLHNQQVRSILDDKIPAITNIVLNPDHRTATFDAQDVDGTPESCHTTYTLRAGTVDSLGQVSCTQSFTVSN